jgi:hypothetical protein
LALAKIEDFFFWCFWFAPSTASKKGSDFFGHTVELFASSYATLDCCKGG